MKIICVGRNYTEHAQELGNAVPKSPVIFIKPKTALTPALKPLIHPLFTIDWQYEAEIVVQICKNGKNIPATSATKFYNQYTLGLDMTARDLQEELKKKGLPWELAKGHDGSAVVGEWKDIDIYTDVQNLRFSLQKNGILVQQGNTEDMIFSINQIVAYVSQFFTLQIGDYIFTGTPAGVGVVDPGDLLEGFIGQEKMFSKIVK